MFRLDALPARVPVWCLLLLAAAAVPGCAGGGGGGSTGGGAPVTYTGLTAPVPIVEGNANAIFALVWTGDAGAPAAPKPAAGTDPLDRLLARTDGLASLKPALAAAKTAVDDTVPGAFGGTLHLTGEVNNDGTGILRLDYRDFDAHGTEVVNGTVTLEVIGYDVATNTMTEWERRFTLIRFTGAAKDLSYSGRIHYTLDEASATERTVYNEVRRDHLRETTNRLVQFVVERRTGPALDDPWACRETRRGRIYGSQVGYVDVETLEPIGFRTCSGGVPPAGGTLRLVGDGSQARVIFPSADRVRIEVDAAGDGDFETVRVYLWSNLLGPPAANAAPVVTAVNVEGDRWRGEHLRFHTLETYDPDGDPITFHWALAVAPPGSTAVLEGVGEADAELVPDRIGGYTAELSVDDGTFHGVSSRVTVVVVNRVPVADPGPDRSAHWGSLVGLDGSASSDADGDPLRFSWVLTAAFPAGSAALVDADTATPALATTTVGTYRIGLTVSDGFDTGTQATVTVTTTNTPPVADAGPAPAAVLDQLVQLDGSASFDPDGDPLTYEWRFDPRPPRGSDSILTSPGGPETAEFTPDLVDTYVVRLIVRDGAGGASSDPISVDVARATPALFSPYVAVASIEELHAVAIADVTGDGRNDVVAPVGYYFPGYPWYVGVFPQDDLGGFDTPVYTTVDTTLVNDRILHSITAGDVNGDLRNDVVVNLDGGIGVLAQRATGSLTGVQFHATSGEANRAARAVRVGDFDGDGRGDVAAIEPLGGAGEVDVFHQDAAGGLGAPDRLPLAGTGTAWTALETGDLNGDGRADLAAVQQSADSEDRIAVFLQNASGGFDPATYLHMSGGAALPSMGLAVGDVTGDGLDDIVASAWQDFRVFPQDGAGGFLPEVLYDTYTVPGQLAIADFNGDGRQDVVIAHPGWTKIGVYLQTPDGTLAREDLYDFPAIDFGVDRLAAGDVNGDGAADIAVADNALVILYNRNLPAP